MVTSIHHYSLNIVAAVLCRGKSQRWTQNHGIKNEVEQKKNYFPFVLINSMEDKA